MRSIKRIVAIGSWRSTSAVEYMASAHSPLLNPQHLKKGSEAVSLELKGKGITMLL